MFYKLLFFFLSDTSKDLHGIYIRSFCRGLDSVLSDYRSALLSLEGEITKDAHLTISYLQYSLHEVETCSVIY